MTIATPLFIFVLLALSGLADSLGFFYASRRRRDERVAGVKNMNPKVPVLFIAPLGDHPPLRSSKQMMFTALPANPLTKLYEPDAEVAARGAARATTETHP